MMLNSARRLAGRASTFAPKFTVRSTTPLLASAGNADVRAFHSDPNRLQAPIARALLQRWPIVGPAVLSSPSRSIHTEPPKLSEAEEVFDDLYDEEVLERSEMLINDLEAHAIARELATNGAIREVRLARCVIPNTSVMIIAGAIGHNPLLEKVEVHDNILSPYGARVLQFVLEDTSRAPHGDYYPPVHDQPLILNDI